MKETISNSDVAFDFCIEVDSKGFSINCDVTQGQEHFKDDMIPGILLVYARQLCKESGQSFEAVLRTALGVPPKRNLIEA